LKIPIVTIDGPAASGKSSVSRAVALAKGWNWVSTGAYYRGLAYVARATGVGFNDEKGLAALATNPIWRVQMSGKATLVHFDNTDVTADIAREDVGSLASQVSQHPLVRSALLKFQRDCALIQPGLVAEGRDCGTMIFPTAQAKIFLTANSSDRAARRSQEPGVEMDMKKTLELQKERDRRDRERPVAPMQIPDSASVIDTSNLTLDEVVKKVLNICQHL
jgi:CMP/dCMP kinase